MNEKEICFILCSNDQMYAEECIHYIKHLNIPEDYQVNVLVVEDAQSMTAGYNEAMKSSQAKYKVYLHHDTFIVNPDFIQDFLDVFHQDEQIGMIGMIGAPILHESGIMWSGKRCGVIYSWNIDNTFEGQADTDVSAEVEVIDGLCMITQYDIPWREDLFDKWDFYDCSQSKEFARRGYKIVVPKMETPWCLHESGCSNLKKYHIERMKFLKEYGKEMEVFKKNNIHKATIILTVHNRKCILQETVKWLENVEGISNIIVVDNASKDGSAEWLSMQSYDYIWFDEGVQGYGKLWNVVLENFETEDYIIFLEAGIYPDQNCFLHLMEALDSEDIGIASPVSNSYYDSNGMINSRETLRPAYQSYMAQSDRGQPQRTLTVNWRLCALRKDSFNKNGCFTEELGMPENVLLDYTLRMTQKGFRQIVCGFACAYDTFQKCGEIYEETDEWRIADRAVLKNIWGMNYFNLRPNKSLVEQIRENKEKEFSVLEIGCDLGATLLEIQNCYPKSKTYGMDINEMAIEIAKYITSAKYGDIDKMEVPFLEKFDYIIFGDVLEHLRHPEEVIRMCYNMLNENGYILASIPNIMHISVLEELLQGRFIYTDTGLLDRTHIHFFTYYEIMLMFQRADYVIEDMGRTVMPISESQKNMENVLLSFSEKTESWMFETFQYVVKARKKNK